MTEPELVLWNTDEQVLSTDLNRIGHLSGKAVMDTLLAMNGGILNANNPLNVVRRGLNATPGSGLQVAIDAGELMQFVAGNTDPISSYKLVAQQASSNVNLNTADPTNPRIDLISVSAAVLQTNLTNRNILTLPSRQITSTPINTTQYPSIAFTYTPGTPAANPTIPATPAGQVALWAVYVPATAVSVLDNNLIDLRVRFHPNAFVGAHFVERGMLPSSATSSLTSLTIPAGRAWVNGTLVDMLAGDQTLSQAQLSNNGASAATSSEYHVYAIGKGNGDPIGKNVTDGVIFVTSSVSPGLDGRPSTPVTYRPFFNGGLNNVLTTTTNALYLGTIHTDVSANYEPGGGGRAFNKNGLDVDPCIDVVGGGFSGLSSGWLKVPQITFVDGNTITLGQCAPIISGQPGVFFSANATFLNNLISTETRTGARYYYVYLRRAVSEQNNPGTWTRGRVGTYVIRLSAEAPNSTLGKPTPESGFQGFEYLYCGSIYDMNGTLKPFFKRGDETIFQYDNDTNFRIYNADGTVLLVPTNPSVATVTAVLPATTRTAIISVQPTLTNTGGANNDNVYVQNGTGGVVGTPFPVLVSSGVAAGGASFNSIFWEQRIATDGSSGFNVFRDSMQGSGSGATLALRIIQRGYVESLERLN